MQKSRSRSPRRQPCERSTREKLPVSVIVAARNEAKNLPRCLESLRDVGEVYVIDSQSTDATVGDCAILWREGRSVSLSGWMAQETSVGDGHSAARRYDWIFLVDADEALTPELAEEIRRAIRESERQRLLHFACACIFWVACCATAVRASGSSPCSAEGKAATSAACKDQDASMADMEVHEHVVVDGATCAPDRIRCFITTSNRSRATFRSTMSIRTGKRACWLRGEQNSTEICPQPSSERKRSGDDGLRRNFLPFPDRRFCCFFYRYFSAPGISGWRSGADLLRLSGRTDVSHQSQDLRTEVQDERRKSERI